VKSPCLQGNYIDWLILPGFALLNIERFSGFAEKGCNTKRWSFWCFGQT